MRELTLYHNYWMGCFVTMVSDAKRCKHVYSTNVKCQKNYRWQNHYGIVALAHWPIRSNWPVLWLSWLTETKDWHLAHPPYHKVRHSICCLSSNLLLLKWSLWYSRLHLSAHRLNAHSGYAHTSAAVLFLLQLNDGTLASVKRTSDKRTFRLSACACAVPLAFIQWHFTLVKRTFSSSWIPGPEAYIESVHENCYSAQSQPITR